MKQGESQLDVTVTLSTSNNSANGEDKHSLAYIQTLTLASVRVWQQETKSVCNTEND